MRRALVVPAPALATLVLGLAMSRAGPAWAGGASVKCADAAERAQSLWKHGKLLDARGALRECLRPGCPPIVRDDCTAWEPQLEAATPTVLVATKNSEGDDLPDVAVTIDGKPLEGTSSGLAAAVDPGSHLFRFLRQGSAPIERTVVVREGEKRRLVEVRFESKPNASPLPLAASPPPAAQAPGSIRGGPPVLAWVFGGAGVAALGGFAVLGITGLERYHALHAECGVTRTCASSEIGSTRAQLWIADGLALVGVVALGAAAWIWIAAGPVRVGAGANDVVIRGTF